MRINVRMEDVVKDLEDDSVDVYRFDPKSIKREIQYDKIGKDKRNKKNFKKSY